jgi:hypothetical protein
LQDRQPAQPPCSEVLHNIYSNLVLVELCSSLIAHRPRPSSPSSHGQGRLCFGGHGHDQIGIFFNRKIESRFCREQTIKEWSRDFAAAEHVGFASIVQAQAQAVSSTLELLGVGLYYTSLIPNQHFHIAGGEFPTQDIDVEIPLKFSPNLPEELKKLIKLNDTILSKELLF